MKFIYGEEEFLINQEIDRFVKNNEGTQVIYDSNESIENIIMDFSTISMFGEDKIFVIKDHELLISSNIYVDEFIEAISKLKIKIIFALNSAKLNKKNKLINYLLSVGETTEFKSITQKRIIPIINKIVSSKQGTIDNSAAIQLSIKLPLNLRIIISEISKLLLESNHITLEMVNKSIGDYVKDDTFALSNAIAAKDSHGIINSYKKLKFASVDHSIIFGQISSFLCLAHLISTYRKKSLNNTQIVTETKIHPFRVKKASEILNFTNQEELEILINKLAKVDKNIKRSKFDPSELLEVFLLELIK